MTSEAANCIELAESVPDVDRRVFLLNMARNWLKLADQAERNGFPGSNQSSSAIDAHPDSPADG
ncbi:MAG: hypothetical protein WBE99_21685 [Xanthobacteraceae bacterium]